MIAAGEGPTLGSAGAVAHRVCVLTQLGKAGSLPIRYGVVIGLRGFAATRGESSLTGREGMSTEVVSSRRLHVMLAPA
jgi:hypothetical protein